MKHIWEHTRFYLKYLEQDRFKDSTIAEVWSEIQETNLITKHINKENKMMRKCFKDHFNLAIINVEQEAERLAVPPGALKEVQKEMGAKRPVEV